MGGIVVLNSALRHSCNLTLFRGDICNHAAEVGHFLGKTPAVSVVRIKADNINILISRPEFKVDVPVLVPGIPDEVDGVRGIGKEEVVQTLGIPQVSYSKLE